MKTIHKYHLEPVTAQEISMPKGAEILSVQFQKLGACIWALVDPEADYEKRTFLQFGTGQEVTGMDNKYLGTFQSYGGDLVFHVFEAAL